MNKILPLVIAILLLTHSLQSQSVFLDPSFGTGGIAFPANLNLPNQSFSNLIIQPDGKILVHDVRYLENSGSQIQVWIHRFMPNGAFDQSFGTGGSVLIAQVVSLFDRGDKHLQLLPNGKILTAYFAFTVFGSVQSTVVRLNADGTFDTTFGNNGQVAIQDVFPPIDNSPIIRDIKLQSNGEIVLIYDIAGTLDHDYGFRVLQPNGHIKPGYEAIHWWTTNGTQEQFIKALGAQNDKILMMGYEVGNPSRLERFEADGTIDENFGNNGLAINSPASAAFTFRDMMVAPDGRISTCGANFFHEFWLARFLPGGVPDPAFGVNGNAFHSNLINTEQYFAMDQVSDGGLVVAGTKGPFTTINAEAAVVKFLPNGALDPTFTPDGMVELTFAETGFYSFFEDVQVLPDRRILACGRSVSPENKLLLVRFLPEAKAVAWYHDFDGDGYGNPLDSVYSAEIPAGYTANNEDCNDNNASINPAAQEICNNGLDDNCNGFTDEDQLAPTAICADSIVVELDLTGFAFLSPDLLDQGSFDNCGMVEFQVTPPQLTMANLGYNSVTLTVIDASGNSTTCVITVELLEKTSGVNPLEASTGIKVFPNPSTGRFQLQMPGGRLGEHAEIFNTAGQLVWAQTASPAATLDLDLSGQISGCYYLRVQSGNEVQVLKLMLVR